EVVHLLSYARHAPLPFVSVIVLAAKGPELCGTRPARLTAPLRGCYQSTFAGRRADVACSTRGSPHATNASASSPRRTMGGSSPSALWPPFTTARTSPR